MLAAETMFETDPKFGPLVERISRQLTDGERRSSSEKDWERAALEIQELPANEWAELLERIHQLTPDRLIEAHRRLVSIASEEKRRSVIEDLVEQSERDVEALAGELFDAGFQFEQWRELSALDQHFVVLSLSCRSHAELEEVVDAVDHCFCEEPGIWNEFFTLAFATNHSTLRGETLRLVGERIVPATRKRLARTRYADYADSAAQTTFVKLMRKKFLESHLAGWFRATALDIAKKQHAKSGRSLSGFANSEVNPDQLFVDWDDDTNVFVEELAEHAKVCIEETLTQRVQAIFRKHFFEAQTFGEISSALSIPLSTLYRIRSKALSTLKDCVNHKRGANR